MSRSGPPKKISSWVRPGVFEVRASARRPVRALIRLDLPTLERPANAISGPAIGGGDEGPLAGEQPTPGLYFGRSEFPTNAAGIAHRRNQTCGTQFSLRRDV